MLFEIISLVIGIIKIVIYKVLFPFRIYFLGIPRLNSNFKIAIKEDSKLLFGKNFRSRNNVSFRIYDGGNVKIGDNCFMNDNCSVNCQKNITIGNNVIFGQNVMLFDHDHDYKNNIENFIKSEITIGDNVWVGANSIILKGVEIGNDVVIGAGTIVKCDIPSGSLVYDKSDITINRISK
ncbi:acyltransferase [Streptococcus equinus]|uniref:acyltransferase n=1 Tax=Streptococcus equinus TaxID=1335 RepID=UPI0008EE58D2|nr:acyltransferase [Streptococcus equinus]SFG22457.1 Acetyltransferase (isoleucine patch superfamily) [Streptococcus equinus]